MSVFQDPGSRPTLLVVDDTPDNLTLIHALFRDTYRLRLANSGAKALQLIAEGDPPDLALLDVMMPDMDGFELCRRLKAGLRTRDVPVIFLTALAEASDERKGFEAGGVDYVTKPINLSLLSARVRTHLELKRSRDLLRDQSLHLQAEVLRRTRQLSEFQDATILALANLGEARDNETGDHLRRTQHYVRRIGQALLDDPRFEGQLDEEFVESLFKVAPLHDVGKIAIRDEILLKPGKLTLEEFEIMKTHARCGWESLQAAIRSMATPSPMLAMAADIALYHHEKWDGSGYPENLAGEAIPLSARIMALADVYDALISRRVYKEPMPQEMALKIIRDGLGCHFDPRIGQLFLDLAPEMQAIARRFQG